MKNVEIMRFIVALDMIHLKTATLIEKRNKGEK